VNALLAHPTLDRRDLSGLRLVIDGGEKMPLPLIERLLRAFPGAWFADAYGLTETAAAEELQEFCRARLARFKVPRDVAFIETLPRNPSGKVLKRELRDQARASGAG